MTIPTPEPDPTLPEPTLPDPTQPDPTLPDPTQTHPRDDQDDLVEVDVADDLPDDGTRRLGDEVDGIPGNAD